MSDQRDLRSQGLQVAECILSPASTLTHYSVFSMPPRLEGLVTRLVTRLVTPLHLGCWEAQATLSPSHGRSYAGPG